MRALAADLLIRVRAFFVNMTAEVAVIYQEQGIEPFKKPLLYALPSLIVIYAVVYSPSSSKVVSRAMELAQFEIISKNYQEYRDDKEKLLIYQARLPLLKDKEEWLNYIITTTAKKSDIVIDSLSAQNVAELSGFVVVSRDVSVVTSYAKLGSWLADMENSPIFLKIVSLSLRKEEKNPGVIVANFRLSTVFPRSAGPAARKKGV